MALNFLWKCKSANHLLYKHSVFGGIVGGLTTFAAMKKVHVDDSRRNLGVQQFMAFQFQRR